MDLVRLLLVAVLAVAAFGVERVMVLRGWEPYFALGFPVGADPVSVPQAPSGAGRTASVRYRTSASGDRVLFWSHPGDRGGPYGLHGTVHLHPGRRGVKLRVVWAPPWTPLLALTWFAALGATTGAGVLTVGVAATLLVVLIHQYLLAARAAALELRWAFVRGDLEGEGPEEPGA
jgi:hypothetical protein